MATFTLTKCPFCFKENANGTVLSYSFPLKKHHLGGMEFYLFGQCNFCHSAIMAISGYDGTFQSEQNIKNHQEHLQACDDIYHYRTKWFPTPPAQDIPQYLPLRVAKKFLQAELLSTQPNMQDPAANAYVLALERSIKHLDGEIAGETLIEKLTVLYDTGLITQRLIEFAQSIDQFHHDKPYEQVDITHADLERLKIFTRLFLMYTLTLPHLIPAPSIAQDDYIQIL